MSDLFINADKDWNQHRIINLAGIEINGATYQDVNFYNVSDWTTGLYGDDDRSIIFFNEAGERKWDIGVNTEADALRRSLMFRKGGNQYVMTLAETGNVGIGTLNPHNLLDLGSSLGQKLAVYQNSAGNDFYGFGISSSTLEFYAGNQLHMVLKSAGKVGIGTNDPAAKTHIVGTDPCLLFLENSDSDAWNHGLRVYTPNQTTGQHTVLADFGKEFDLRNSAHIDFYYAGDGSYDNCLTMGLYAVDDILNLTGSRRVGVNTKTPQAGFHFTGPVSTKHAPADSADNGILLKNDGNGNYAIELWSIDGGGYIDWSWTAGKDWDWRIITHASDTRMRWVGSDGGIKQYLDQSGNLWISGSLTQGSDARLKNITGEIENGLDVILKLRPVEYTRKDQESLKLQYGLIAQEVLEVVPSAVSHTGEFYSVDYIQLIPLIIKAIQDLNNKFLGTKTKNTIKKTATGIINTIKKAATFDAPEAHEIDITT